MNISDSIMAGAISNITNIFGFALTIVSVTSVLVYVDFTAAFIILASSALSMLIKSKRNKIEFQKEIDFTPIIRKGHYITRLFKQDDYAKELRITELHKNLEHEYDENTKDYNKLAKTYGLKKVFIDIIEGLNSESIYIAVIGVVLYKMMVVGSVLLGGITVVVNANWQLRNAAVTFAENIAALPQQSLYIDRLRTFLEYKPSTIGGNTKAGNFEKS